MYLDVLLRDHELNIDCCDSRQCAPIEELLCGEANTNLQLQALQVDICVALGLYKALLQLEVAASERSRKVIGLKNDRIVRHIIVEIDYFVVLGQVE